MKMIAPKRCIVLVSHQPMNLSLSPLVVVISRRFEEMTKDQAKV